MLTRLAEVMDARGVQPAALARASGMDPSTLSKLVLGKRKFTREWALKLAHHLGVQPDELMMEVGRPVPDIAFELPAAKAAAAPEALPPRAQMPRDVPVYGTAMGANGDGAFELNQTGGIVDMVLRGPGVAHSRNVFAIYVEGESMTPRHRPGELRYCDPGRTPRSGDDVVIVLAAAEPGRPPQAFLKELVRRTATEIITRQSAPERELRFPVDRVKQVIRVLTMNEVMGV
jgi:phage repressor protein C with HTH and peptisase S24 domain